MVEVTVLLYTATGDNFGKKIIYSDVFIIVFYNLLVETPL